MAKQTKNNKFIGAFVNEMYAILLGIGIGNVLFVQQIDLNNAFEIIMGLFVTGVVLLYWWDWTEFLNDNVVTTKSEFIIDFLILIFLEILFVYFNKPVNLGMIFIFLSALDLFWVINYIYINSGKFFAKNRLWIFEKIVAIVLFTGVYTINKHLLTDLNNHLYFQGGLIIIAFLAVRKISFRQVKKAERYSFEMASHDDFKEISRINNEYLNSESQDSFMISELNVDIIKERLNKNYMYYILRAEGNAEILGFIELSPSVGNEVLKNVTWQGKDEREKIMDSNTKLLYIEKVAVNKSYKHQGIGTSLYINLFSEFKNYSFYSFVTEKPKMNSASIRFHQKIGFEPLGIFKAPEFAGFKNYQSILFFKK